MYEAPHILYVTRILIKRYCNLYYTRVVYIIETMLKNLELDRKSLYTKEGYRDFSLHYKTMSFQNGVNKLIKSMEQGYVFALMCAEKDPINCHRAIMVSRYFSKLGYMVTHIEPNGVEETQEDLDFRLLEKFFPDRNQLSLFAESFKPVDHDALVEKAYKMQNAVIGYRLEDDET